MTDDRDGDSQSPPDPRLPCTARKREAEEWALVLTAVGLDARVVRGPRGFSVSVSSDEIDQAAEILSSWQEERAERARRHSLPVPRGATPFETAMAYACAIALLSFHLGLARAGRWADFVDLGASRAALVLDGQVWRLATALTLHSDLPHVLGNTLFGGFFLAALAGRLGIGLALLAFVTTGALGNLANALYYGSAHSSIGASTGVFGLVGVLAGLAAWRRHQTAPPGRGAWVAFAAGLAIVAMLGTGGPQVDFSAHLFGLAAGGLTGLLLAIPAARWPTPGHTGQWIAALSALAVLLGAWAQARPWTLGIGGS
ncbi:MAG: rhomboid family intramembrane serine protease [Deltaproteobacteria bacterium]|nr:rhomboid family intramembrane serine protease [Deltaproteobacteria bacterium]